MSSEFRAAKRVWTIHEPGFSLTHSDIYWTWNEHIWKPAIFKANHKTSTPSELTVMLLYIHADHIKENWIIILISYLIWTQNECAAMTSYSTINIPLSQSNETVNLISEKYPAFISRAIGISKEGVECLSSFESCWSSSWFLLETRPSLDSYWEQTFWVPN